MPLGHSLAFPYILSEAGTETRSKIFVEQSHFWVWSVWIKLKSNASKQLFKIYPKKKKKSKTILNIYSRKKKKIKWHWNAIFFLSRNVNKCRTRVTCANFLLKVNESSIFNSWDMGENISYYPLYIRFESIYLTFFLLKMD